MVTSAPRSSAPAKSDRCRLVVTSGQLPSSSKRTAAALAIATCINLASPFGNVAYASPSTLNQPSDPNNSPLVQELLRRTEEKKEERVKERLDNYNKRNFKDYFDVVDKGYSGRTVTENDLKIRKQLEKWNGK